MRITLHRQVLVGLSELSVQISLAEDGGNDIFLPLLRTELETAVGKMLLQRGLIVSPTAQSVLQVDIRVRVSGGITGTGVNMVKIETTLREPVLVTRAATVATIDTWRHQSTAAAFAGGQVSKEAADLIRAEVLHQAEEFLKDLQQSGALQSLRDEPVLFASPRVDRAKTLLLAGGTYAQGCSKFISDVLNITYEDANSLMGSAPTYVGDNNNYPGLISGDIVGWKVSGGMGHVAIFVGEPGTKLIDVRDLGGTPRRVVNGYGSGQAVYKSSKY